MKFQLEGLLWLAMALGLATSCADEPRTVQPPALAKLSLELPTCGKFERCSRRMGIESPRTLVLEDAAGVERFSLREPEFSALDEIAELPEFRSAISKSESWDCPEPNVHDPWLRVSWADGSINEVRIVDGCFLEPDEPLGMYELLRTRLVELKLSYLSCPSVPALPTDVDPSADLPVRALCFACLGQC